MIDKRAAVGLNMKVKIYLFLSIYWSLGFVGKGQVAEDVVVRTPPNQQMISVYYHQGIVIPHHPNMIYFIDDFARGIELNYGFLRFDAGGWQKWYNFPEVGLGFTYNSLGNSGIYGKGIALFPYLHFPLIRTSKFVLSDKLALGLGYTNKPFDYRKNPYNHIFGSHFNAYIGLGLYASYRLLKDWSLSASASLNHMSNGAMAKPNNGINTFTLSVGAQYHFVPDLFPRLAHPVVPRRNEREIQVVGSYGSSQASDYNFNQYSSGSLSIQHLWYRSAKSAWSAGVDLIYYGAAPYVFQRYDEANPDASRLLYGVSGGKYWIMGTTIPFVQLGVYLPSEIEPPQQLYPRVGIRQKITEHLMANFSVKASFFRAEFIEFGLGYCFDYKKNTL